MLFSLVWFFSLLLHLEVGNHLLCKMGTRLALCGCPCVFGEGGRRFHGFLSGHIQVVLIFIFCLFVSLFGWVFLRTFFILVFSLVEEYGAHFPLLAMGESKWLLWRD